VAQPELQARLIADVGTGAGFPGLPLARGLAAAQQFTLIDSVAKKIRFVSHAARTLELANVTRCRRAWRRCHRRSRSIP
jgi:16S rRNA (guanine527-N7)-methyltransferase